MYLDSEAEEWTFGRGGVAMLAVVLWDHSMDWLVVQRKVALLGLWCVWRLKALNIDECCNFCRRAVSGS